MVPFPEGLTSGENSFGEDELASELFYPVRTNSGNMFCILIRHHNDNSKQTMSKNQ